MTPGPLAEAAIAASVGAAIGAAAGNLVDAALPVAVVAGANGAISGWRGIYAWRTRAGLTAFALDSTWAIATTSAGVVSHVVAAARGRPGFSRELSVRRNRHVYARGIPQRKGFAMSLGNVVSGAGDLTRPRRAKLVTDHEDVHIWQARWFGPLYPVLYVGWMAGGAVAGFAVWLTARRDQPLAKIVESCAYYVNPFEWWAYSRDDNWPPSGLVSRLGWTRPAVRPFASLR